MDLAWENLNINGGDLIRKVKVFEFIWTLIADLAQQISTADAAPTSLSVVRGF